MFKRRKRYVVAGLVLVLLGVWVMVALPMFLLPSKERDKEWYRTHVKPAIEENESEMKLSTISQPEQGALQKLNKWLVFEKDFRTHWVIACAAFAVALTLVVLGLMTILFGRIKDLEAFCREQTNITIR